MLFLIVSTTRVWILIFPFNTTIFIMIMLSMSSHVETVVLLNKK